MSENSENVDSFIKHVYKLPVLVKFDNLQADKVYFWILIKISFQKSIYKKIAQKNEKLVKFRQNNKCIQNS